MSETINLTASNASLTASGASALPVLTSGMQNHVLCHFTFADVWSGLTKVAVFRAGDKHRSISREYWLDDSTVAIPPEILSASGYRVHVGLYGYSGTPDNIIIPTVECCIGTVLKGSDPSGDAPADETRPLWLQIQQSLGERNDLETENKESIVAAINETIRKIGNLDALETEEKESLVAAINEAVSKGACIVKYNDFNDFRALYAAVSGNQPVYCLKGDGELDGLYAAIGYDLGVVYFARPDELDTCICSASFSGDGGIIWDWHRVRPVSYENPETKGNAYFTANGTHVGNAKYIGVLFNNADVAPEDAAALADNADDPRLKLHGGTRNIDIMASTDQDDGKNVIEILGDNKKNNTHLSGILDPREGHPNDAANKQYVDKKVEELELDFEEVKDMPRGIPYVNAESLDGVNYAATFEGLPEIRTGSNGHHSGKGTQILFVPSITSNSDAPTLRMNGGEAVPICLRSDANRGENDSRPSVAVPLTRPDLLQVGVPYQMTFCGVSWMIDSLISGVESGASGGGSGVEAVNLKTGKVTLTADDVGAALASLNWQSATAGYNLYNTHIEAITVKDYMFEVLPQGCYYIRQDEGCYFIINIALGALEEDEVTGVSSRNGPITRAFCFVPVFTEDDTVDGGIYYESLELVKVSSTADLESLTFCILGSNVLTEADLTAAMSGYVTATQFNNFLNTLGSSFETIANVDLKIAQAQSELTEYMQDNYATPQDVQEAIAETLEGTVPVNDLTVEDEIILNGNDKAIKLYNGYDAETGDERHLAVEDEDGEPVRIQGVADPMYDTDAANKEYVDQSLEDYGFERMAFGIDLSDEYAALAEEHPEWTAFATIVRALAKTVSYDDKFYLTSPDGDFARFEIKTVGAGADAIKYTLLWFMPNGTDMLSFEYYKGDTQILGTSSPDGVLRLDILGKQTVFKDEFLSAMAGVPSRESVSAEMAQKVNEVTQTYNALSVIRTRLQKFSANPHTIRVEIDNADKLVDEEDVILQLWVCSRKHGAAHHWWHPSQPGSPTKTSPIGYAMIAGDLIYPNCPRKTARFPAVPEWMPNNGYMLTEIPVTAQDLKNGYVDIDCSTYFLSFIKPSGTTWKYKDVVMMFTQRGKDVSRRYSVPVTWKVAVLRNGSYHQIGGAENTARIGFIRYASGDLVGGTSKSKRLNLLHISIK